VQIIGRAAAVGPVTRKMIMVVLQSLFGFAAAAIGWLTLEFLGRPLRRFFDLRGDTVELLTRIANVRAAYSHFHEELRIASMTPELTSGEIEALANAQKDIRTLASKFRAFALNETLASKAVVRLGYDPYSAAQGLIGLSNTIDTYGKDRNEQKKTVSEALKFKPFDL
jgi:hypothetical protein